MITATTIDEVIQHLDAIITWSRLKKSRIGYFAVLYRSMTMAVKNGIAVGSFENGARMALLDVNFANRYIQAWEAYTNGRPCSNAWCRAFNASENNKLAVLQHLILGINTHINLDLAIAAADTCPGDTIHGLKNDFEKINDVISALTQGVQDKLTRIWWPLKLITDITNNRHKAVLNFSITKARETSWANALALSVVENENRENYIGIIDQVVVEVADKVISPGCLASLVLKPVVLMEAKDPVRIIDILMEE
jgi:hypothetical protein